MVYAHVISEPLEIRGQIIDKMRKKECIFMKKIPFTIFIRHFLASLLAMVATAAFLLGASSFQVNHLQWTNLIGYGILFVALPVALVFLFRKTKPLRWYLIGMSILVIFLSVSWYYFRITVVNTDIAVYATNNSPFMHAARMVLPEPSSIPEDASFSHKKKATSEIIELTIPLSNDKQEASGDYVEQAFNDMLAAYSEQYYFRADSELLYIDGNLYNCYIFNIEGCDYAVAYNLCTETHKIQYLFFSSAQLSWMGAQSALKIEGYLS